MKKKNTLFLMALVILMVSAQAYGSDSNEIPKEVLFQTINVILLIGFLFLITRKKVIAHLAGRVTSHEEAKKKANQVLLDAKEQHEDISLRLKELQETEESVVARAKEDAEKTRTKLVEEAEVLAKRLSEEARRVALYEKEKAIQDLRSEAISRAMKLAEESMSSKMTKEDRALLGQQFVESIEVHH